MVAAIALVTLPHLVRLPLPVAATLLAVLGWRVGALLLGWPLPRPGQRGLVALKVALALALTLGVVVAYRGGLGREAGVTLLTVMAALKLLELDAERDCYVAVFLGLFLLVTHFFYDQSLATGAFLFLALTLFIGCLVRLNDRRARPPAALLKLAGALVVQALPLMLLAFLLFPRLPGPLWGLPKDAYASLTGLSGEMNPGAVSELALSDEVAFRVEFLDAEPPEPARLYWRGPVMWDTDGRGWRAGPPEPAPPALEPRGPALRYSVTLEPSNQPWLLGLDLPAELSEASLAARVTGDFQLLAAQPVRRRIAYQALSYPEHRAAGSSPEALRRALALPPGAHPRTVALARRWRGETAEPRALAERALALFREQPFYYTLSPPLALADPVDEFLFDTRRGFCEHFASAFTVLMRAAGVPARVVTGYQGGERNSVAGFLTVRQRDAHAWAEVWLPGEGWRRVDPTAAVAPERIEQGVEAALPRPVSALRAVLGDNATAGALWRQLRDGWETFNHQWNRWVLGYGAQRQRELLARLGLERLTGARLGLALVGTLMLAGALVALWVLRRTWQGDPVQQAYARFCRRLAGVGLARGPGEGPLDFAARSARARPDLGPAIERVTALYVALRYGRAYAADRARAAALRAAVRAFRPGRRQGTPGEDR